MGNQPLTTQPGPNHQPTRDRLSKGLGSRGCTRPGRPQQRHQRQHLARSASLANQKAGRGPFLVFVWLTALMLWLAPVSLPEFMNLNNFLGKTIFVVNKQIWLFLGHPSTQPVSCFVSAFGSCPTAWDLLTCSARVMLSCCVHDLGVLLVVVAGWNQTSRLVFQ